MPNCGKLRYQVSYYDKLNEKWLKGGKFTDLYKVAKILDVSYPSAVNIYHNKASKLCKYFKIDKI